MRSDVRKFVASLRIDYEFKIFQTSKIATIKRCALAIRGRHRAFRSIFIYTELCSDCVVGSESCPLFHILSANGPLFVCKCHAIALTR